MEHESWQVEDNTNTSKGYLRLTRDGKRVADFFPFAHGTNETWVRKQAALIAEVMNQRGPSPTDETPEPREGRNKGE